MRMCWCGSLSVCLTALHSRMHRAAAMLWMRRELTVRSTGPRVCAFPLLPAIRLLAVVAQYYQFLRLGFSG